MAKQEENAVGGKIIRREKVAVGSSSGYADRIIFAIELEEAEGNGSKKRTVIYGHNCYTPGWQTAPKIDALALLSVGDYVKCVVDKTGHDPAHKWIVKELIVDASELTESL